jgi:hypothetical protein
MLNIKVFKLIMIWLLLQFILPLRVVLLCSAVKLVIFASLVRTGIRDSLFDLTAAKRQLRNRVPLLRLQRLPLLLFDLRFKS